MSNPMTNGAPQGSGRWRSVAVQLPLLLIGALVITILVTGLVGSGFSLVGLVNALQSNQETLALLQARQIEQQFSQHLNTLEGLANREPIRAQLEIANRNYSELDETAMASHLADRSQAWAEALAREGRESNSLIILTARNHSTVRSDLGPERSSLLLNLGINTEFIIVDQLGAVVSATRIPDSYLQTEEWWWSALQGQNAPLVYGPLPHPDQPELQIMEFVVPIYDAEQVLIGALYSSYNYSAVQETLAQLLGQSGRAMLVDSNGRVFEAPPDISDLNQFDLLLDQAVNDLYRFRGPDNQWYVLTALPLISPIDTISDLGWYVAVMQPQTAILSPIVGAILPAFLVASLISLFVVVLLYTAYIRPLAKDLARLQAGAEAVQEGVLQTQVAVRRDDELGMLARSFNQMAARLQNQIQRQDQTIAQRTAALQKQARQLETAANVGRVANASLDLTTLMRDAVNLIRGGFGHYHVAIFLIDGPHRYAVVREATGEVGRLLKERPHRLAIGSASIIGQTTAHRRALIINNVRSNPHYFQNPLLPDTRSEAALPLLTQDQLLGVLDIQSSDPNAFPDEDRALLQLMADQIAAAIYNARLFRESQMRFQETEALFHFTALLTTTLDVPEIYRRAARTLSEQIDAARCRFAHWETNSQTLNPQVEFIYYDGPRLAEEFVMYERGEAILDQPYLLKVMSSGEPLLIQPGDKEVIAAEMDYLQAVQLASALHIPLAVGNQPIGLVSLYRSHDQASFSEHEIRQAQAMANQAATALNNALLTSRAQNQAAQTSTLYRISQTLASASDLRSVFLVAQYEIMSLTNTTGISLLLLDEERAELRWLYVFEYGQEMDVSHLEPVPTDRGFSGYVARNGEPLLLRELTPEVRQRYGSWTIQGSASAASYLGMPLKVAQEVIGVLAVENGEEKNAFTEQDLQLLTTIASSVAITIQNQRLWDQTQNALLRQSEQALRLQAAAEVAAAASSILAIEELMQTAVSLIQERFALYYVGLFLIDDQGQRAVLKAGTGEAGRQQMARQYRLTVGGKSLIGSATATGQPRIEQNVRGVVDWQPNPFLPDTHSELALPLRVRGHTIGALTVQSAQPDEFSAELVGILQTMSDQIATAIENANLFATVQNSLARSEQLYQTGQKISAASNNLTVYQALVDFASQLETFSVVHIATVDPQMPEHVYVPVIWSKRPVLMNTGASHIAFVEFPAGQMMLQNRQVVLADIQHNPRVDRHSRVIMRRNKLNSCTMLPIQAEGEWLATLVLHQESRQPAEEADLQPLLTLCAQAGIALSNQRLLAETGALYRIGRLLNQVQTQNEALKITVEQLANHLQLRQCHIVLYNELLAEGYIAASVTPIEPIADARLPMLGDYAFETMELEQRPLFLQDIDEQPADMVQSAAALLRPFGLKSALLAPAVSQNRLIGFISLDSYRGRSFTTAETNFAQAIADQFTITIEGIKQFDEALRRAQELVSLNQIGSRISGILGLKELAETVYHETGQILDNSIFLLASFDAVKRYYEPVLFTNNNQQIELPGRMLGSDEPLYRFLHGSLPLVADPRTPIMANEGSLSYLPAEQWPKSAVWVPLQQEEKPAGLLSLMSPRPHAYSDNDIQLLRSIATQTGLALSNAALFQQTQQSVAELRTLFNITQAAAASIDAQERVNNIVKALHENLKQASVAILLINESDEMLETAAQQGNLPLPAKLPLEHGLVGQVVNLGQPLLVNDLQELPEFMDANRPVLSQLVVPLNLGRRTIGVINIESAAVDTFTEADLRMVQTVSVSLAATIESGRLFQEIQAANEQLRELDRVKTQFLANMSHELRTPLNSIIGFSRVILKGIDGPITPEQAEDLNSIHNSGQHLLRLINDILDLAKIEAGKIALAFEELDLNEEIQDVLSTIRGLISEKPVKLIWHIEPDLPLIEADPVRLRQILLNLLSNAAKFTEKGHIKLDIRRSGRRHVDIAVADTGPGVRPEDYDKLFRAFEQADASPTRAVGGTGLGLSITRRLIELHQGDIWFESQIGQGTVFTIRLPLRQDTAGGRPTTGDIVGPAEDQEERHQLNLKMNQLSGNGRSLSPKRPAILIIEDDPGVFSLYERYFREKPYQLLLANSGIAALSEIAQHQEEIDLVLLDINMPDLDGWDVLKVIRENPVTNNIPVLVCSIENDPQKAAELGAQRLLPKPIMEKELLEAVAEYLP